MNKDFKFAMSAFLEDFRYHKSLEAIKDEPLGSIFSDIEYALIAAAVEKLANDNGLEVPSWVNNKKYFLEKPYYEYDLNNDEYKKWVVSESPEEYMKRNIFVNKDTIDRV